MMSSSLDLVMSCIILGREMRNQRSTHSGKQYLQEAVFRDGEGNGTPLQYSCLENPMDEEAWWAAVHGIFQARVLEWGAIAFSISKHCFLQILLA